MKIDLKELMCKKIAPLKDLFDKPISEICLNVKNVNEIQTISNFINQEGPTDVKIKITNEGNELIFKLKNKRLINRKSLNILKNKDILTTIH